MSLNRNKTKIWVFFLIKISVLYGVKFPAVVIYCWFEGRIDGVGRGHVDQKNHQNGALPK